MRNFGLAGALALFGLALAAPAMADDPNDPLMKDPKARARDAAMIRQLNRDMLAQVQERDARYARDWQAYREQPAREAEYRAAMADHARTQRQYAEDRAAYEAKMAAWREAVQRCRAGDYRYCDN